MQKQSKNFLVFAESCTEAEGRMSEWMPANYQDPEVCDVKKTNIAELRLKGDSETYWLIKTMDDCDGKAEKAVPVLMVYDANHLEEAVRKCAADTSAEMENVTKFKVIVDEDLIDQSTKKITRKVIPVAVTADDED